MAEVGGLVAHGRHDAAPEPPVFGGLGQAQCLEEIALRQAVQAAVVGRPGGEHGSLGDGGTQLAAYLIGVAAGEQAGGVTIEEVNQGTAGVGSAEPVVQPGEQRRGRADPRDIGAADRSSVAAMPGCWPRAVAGPTRTP